MKKVKKVAKVICTYLGPRRSGLFNNPTNMMSYLERNILNEIVIDNKIDTDLIIINNDCGNPKIDKKIDRFNGVLTRNGKIIVSHRKNIGGSFGAYFDAFEKFSDEYDYWFFSEDDHIIYKEGYMKDFVNHLDSDKLLGYVCLAPITTHNGSFPKHSGGSIGLTSTEHFKKIYGKNSKCNFRGKMSENAAYGELQLYETLFNSNFLVYGGLELTNHPDYSELPANCKNKNLYENYQKFFSSENLKKEFIYIVGEINDAIILEDGDIVDEEEVDDIVSKGDVGNLFRKKYKPHNPKFVEY
jgi:hypothetical protein